MPKSFHSRITRAPRQQKFLRPKRSIQRLQPLPLSSSRDQSTLTQIDFVRSTPRDSEQDFKEDGRSSSDDDQECVEMPSGKRRKVFGHRLKQTTVTQNWRDFVALDETESLDHSEAEAHSNGNARMRVLCPPTRSATGRPSQSPQPRQDKREQREAANRPEGAGQAPQAGTLSDAQHLMSIASSQTTRLSMELEPSDTEQDVTRPTTAETTTIYRTPRKPRRTEVPSSQTPSSIHLSRTSRPDVQVCQNSPLRERSGNSQFAAATTSRAKSQDSYDGEHKVDFTEEFDSGTVKSSPLVNASIARPIFTPRKCTKRKAGGTEGRAASQSQLGYSQKVVGHAACSEADGRSIAFHEAESEQSPAETFARPSRSLRRQTTVQESQVDSEWEDLEPRRSDHEASVRDVLAGTYDPMFQQTFDPVSAALERDAVRFGQGGTQAVIGAQLRNSVAISGDTNQPDTSDGRADARQCTKRRQTPEIDFAEIVASSLPEERDPMPRSLQPEEASQLVEQPSDSWEQDELQKLDARFEDRKDYTSLVQRERTSAFGADDVLEATALISTDHMEGLGTKHVRASQISTVVPTQLMRPVSAHEESQAQILHTDTLGSSSFPLPPLTEPLNISRISGTQVTDFSLPLPPSLSPRQDTNLTG